MLQDRLHELSQHLLRIPLLGGAAMSTSQRAGRVRSGCLYRHLNIRDPQLDVRTASLSILHPSLETYRWPVSAAHAPPAHGAHLQKGRVCQSMWPMPSQRPIQLDALLVPFQATQTKCTEPSWVCLFFLRETPQNGFGVPFGFPFKQPTNHVPSEETSKLAKRPNGRGLRFPRSHQLGAGPSGPWLKHVAAPACQEPACPPCMNGCMYARI